MHVFYTLMKHLKRFLKIDVVFVQELFTPFVEKSEAVA